MVNISGKRKSRDEGKACREAGEKVIVLGGVSTGYVKVRECSRKGEREGIAGNECNDNITRFLFFHIFFTPTP